MGNVVYFTPFLCATYALNEWLIGNKLGLPAASTKGTAAWLLFDQFVNAPMVVFGFFCTFTLTDALSSVLFAGARFSLANVVSLAAAKLRTEYIGTMISNWKIWIVPQLLNFA